MEHSYLVKDDKMLTFPTMAEEIGETKSQFEVHKSRVVHVSRFEGIQPRTRLQIFFLSP
jgi:hypothetical protein